MNLLSLEEPNLKVGILPSGSNDQEDLFILSVRPEWAECHTTGSAKLRLRMGRMLSRVVTYPTAVEDF